MNNKTVCIKGTMVQIQQNTNNSSQTIENTKSNSIDESVINKILEHEAEFIKLYGEDNAQLFKSLLLELRRNDSESKAKKQTIIDKIKTIAIGASSNVISEGILHFINQI